MGKLTPESARGLGSQGGKMRVARTKLEEYAGRPLDFVRQLVDPETGKPFDLYPAQERFLSALLTLNDEGRAAYPEAIFAAPKKSGKTTIAALAQIYVVRVMGGRYAEGLCVANDLEQATGRVFRAIKRIIQATPLLRSTAKLYREKVEFKATGGIIEAIGASYASAAGANPNITTFDELWAYTSERSRRLWDELVPVPTRRISMRLTTTYAGFEGESELLEDLYRQGLKGEQPSPALYTQPGMLMFWTHDPVAPWQSDEWLAQMRRQLRPNAYLRLIENRFVTTESGFVLPEWWQACVNAELRPVVADSDLPVWVGVDASVKRDTTAIVAVTWDPAVKRVRLVWHKSWQPSPENPIDFAATVEATLLEMRSRFRLKRVLFDPYQLQATAQRLSKMGIRMEEFPQSTPNLTEASSGLYDLIKGRNLEVYPDEAFAKAIHQAVAIEGSRGWRIAKEKAAHKIDLVVALAQACLGAVQASVRRETPIVAPISLTQVNRFGGDGTGPTNDPDRRYKSVYDGAPGNRPKGRVPWSIP